MATTTAHFGLIKPGTSDMARISEINTNSDNIDRIMYDNQQRSEKTVANTAVEYSTAESYAVGDIVTHDDVLYKCISATSGEWDASRWESTTIVENLGGGDFAEIKALQTDNASKNLLHISDKLVSGAQYGINYTVHRNNAGEVTSITLDSGTATRIFRLSLFANELNLPNKVNGYILSGCPEGGGADKYGILGIFTDNVSALNTDFGEGLVISNATAYKGIFVAQGYTIPEDGLTFHPMIRYADIKDDTFEPYYRSVKQLDAELTEVTETVEDYISSDNDIAITTATTLTDSKSGSLKFNTISGKSGQETTTGKNLLKNTATSQTINGITFMVNEDGSVTANGTATNDASLLLRGNNASEQFTFSEPYIYSGCPVGGSNETYQMYIYGISIGNIRCFGDEVNLQPGTYANLSILIRSGYTANNLTFYPMLRLADIEDDTYEPYTGGKPSPNPDYPQEIKSVVVNGIRTNGKNLLSSVTNKRILNQYSPVLQFETDLQPNTEYILSFNASSGLKLYTNERVTEQVDFTSVDGRNTVTFKTLPLLNKENINVYNGSAGGWIALKNYIYQSTTPDFSDVMLTLASETDQTYEPYQSSTVFLASPITLNGIGDVKDAIVRKDGLWQVERKLGNEILGVTILPANTLWIVNGKGWLAHNIIPNAKNIAGGSTVANAMSDKFTVDTAGKVSGAAGVGKFGFGYNTGFYINIEDVPTTSTNTRVNEWFTDNPTRIIYELKTPTYEVLPDADQIALNSLLTFDEVTYLEFIWDSLVPDFEAEYGISKVGATALRADERSESVELKVYNIIGAENAGFHNSIYRGRYLGDHVTAKQYDDISSGTFDGLFIGDYWTIDGVNWRIAHFDYWLKTGDTECTTHHVVIVPDKNLYTAQMNESNITTGGYAESKMYTANLDNAKTTIHNAFGAAHILNHRELLTSAVTDGYPSAGKWVDSTINLMNEPMVYGSYIFTPGSTGTVTPYRYTDSNTQLALFRLDPSHITNRAYWWLRDVVTAVLFANVNNYGTTSYGYASAAYGVRPAFGIIGQEGN